ncbi:hypothetical protein NDU88_002805 [Pleurodeles waltl]|uniref:Uncharacterized protein n=1 Tax=Pleurodeles waltl TaxID=8319 RepID=A0AAV7RDT9_PLEWA|nr:hypothetical protein NDU88_002805 [Pleurodeles waltl]
MERSSVRKEETTYEQDDALEIVWGDTGEGTPTDCNLSEAGTRSIDYHLPLRGQSSAGAEEEDGPHRCSPVIGGTTILSAWRPAMH